MDKAPYSFQTARAGWEQCHTGEWIKIIQTPGIIRIRRVKDKPVLDPLPDFTTLVSEKMLQKHDNFWNVIWPKMPEEAKSKWTQV